LAKSYVLGLQAHVWRASVTKLFLVRHAHNVHSREQPDHEWPLSPTGEAQAHRLAHLLRELRIDVVVSSECRRTRASVEPFSIANGAPIFLESDLRGRLLSSDWITDWDAVLDDLHGDPEYCLPGGESANSSRIRFEGALHRIAKRWSGARVAVATHGIVIAHLMRHQNRVLPAAYYRKIQCPHVFELTWGEAARWEAEYTLDGAPGVFAEAVSLGNL